MSHWEKIYKSTWILIVVVCVVGLVCLFLPQYAKHRELERKKAAESEAIRQDEKRLHKLRENGDRFSTDPAFVEEIARRDGMARTNEMIFRCVDDPPVASNAASRQP
jgi:cell division protein FtsB